MKAGTEQQFKCMSHNSICQATNDSHELVKAKSKAWKQLFEKIIHNWRTRSRLSTLNEAQLKDIGLTAADVDHEIHKPLWK